MAKQKPSIYDLVVSSPTNDNVIKVGQAFFARDYMGTIVDSRHVKIEYEGEGLDPRNMENRMYKSFSEAATRMCGTNVNAWLFWKYWKGKEPSQMEPRPIDDWRQEWIDKNGFPDRP